MYRRKEEVPRNPICRLCGPVTHHEAEFLVTYGRSDRYLRICKWCQQDLVLFGFRATQTVYIGPAKHGRTFFGVFGIPVALEDLQRQNLHTPWKSLKQEVTA